MYFREEMVIPVGEKSFAVLCALDVDDCECGDEECHCHNEEDDDDDNVVIARIDFDEDGLKKLKQLTKNSLKNGTKNNNQPAGPCVRHFLSTTV